MGYYEETREIYVKVNSKEDYDTVKKIFEKYEISTECINDIKVIYNVYVYMDEDDFQEFRYEIYEAVADCLVLATCDKYHSVGGSCGYEIFSHYPNQEDWDEHYLCDDENSCPVGVYGINDLKSCLDFIHRAQLKLDVASKVAIYKIWGENIDEETFTAVENDDSAETFLKSLIINNPVTVGNLSRKSKTIYRLCAIAKDDEIMQLIKNGIKECVNKGDEIVSKATYISDKQMMYFVAADFYESDYQGKIEYAVNDLLEKAKGKFIILVDCFVAYNEDDYYSEEGYAECSLGSDMKYFSWDCCTYDEEMEDNFDVNITDVLGYLNTYGFEMEYDEKVFISSFKYDNDSDIQKIQSAREAVAGDLRVRAKEGYDASLKAWEEENKNIIEKRETEKCKAREKLNRKRDEKLQQLCNEYTSKKKRIEKEIQRLNKSTEETKKLLEKVGFFDFSKKSEFKKIIKCNQESVEKLKQDLISAEQAHKNQVYELNNDYDTKIKKEEEKIEEEIIPKFKPRKPESLCNQGELTYREVERRVVSLFVEGRLYNLSELKERIPPKYHNYTASVVNNLLKEGLIEKNESEYETVYSWAYWKGITPVNVPYDDI